MIERILPDGVVAVSTRADLDVALLPEEQTALGRAVEKRRREFTTVRACARTAYERLGVAASAVTSGERGEPRWSPGAVGSITHCDGYRACALARASEFAAIGIDAEPNLPLRPELLPDIARPEELPRLRALAAAAPDVHWDRLLFSAKESVYKVWFPLARSWLGFEDAVLEIDREAGSFSARLLVPGPLVEGRRLTTLTGRWLVADGLVATAIALPIGTRLP